MSEISPRTWRLVRLEDVLSQGPSNGRSVRTLDGGFPVLRLTSLGQGGRVNLAEAKGGAWTRDEAEPFIVRDGDFLISRGNGSLALVGVGGLVRAPQSQAAFPDTIIRVRPDEEVLLPEYLAAVWNSPVVRQQIEGSARTTAGIYKINQGHVRNVTFPLPPLPEQRRIVYEIERRLSHLEAASRSLTIARKKLRRAQDAIERELFWEQSPADTPLSVLLENGLANGRSVKSREGGFPVLRLTCLREAGSIDLAEYKEGDWERADAERFIVRDGDFLLSRGNGTLSLVGRGGLVRAPQVEVAFPDTLIRVRVDPARMLPEFLSAVWNSSGVRRQLEAEARTTAGIYKINQKQVSNVRLPVPVLADQACLVAEFDRRLSLIQATERAIQTSTAALAQTSRSVLREAFMGRLVPQDPDEGPADQLLDRSRQARAAGANKTARRRTSTTAKEAVT
jgi:type I restriction enzyme, S subunit